MLQETTNAAVSNAAGLQQMGFAMAVAVLLDALVIRCLAVPAAMRLLGERAWWLPRWLDRRLPPLHVEGSQVASTPAGEAAVTART